MDQEIAKYIIDVLRQTEQRHHRQFIEDSCIHAGTEASYAMWKEKNPDDGVGGMSRNPYSPPSTARNRDHSQALWQLSNRAVYAAMYEFLDKKPEEVEPKQS